jgi:tetratricopeptide (TPR) repeat protein
MEFDKRKITVLAILIAFGTLLFSCTLDAADPNRFDRLYKDAQASYSSKDYASSLKTYITITDEFPGKVEGYRGIVAILLDKNILDKTETVINGAKGKIDNKEIAKFYISIGDKYYSILDYNNAYEMYKKAYDLDINNQQIRLRNLRCAIKLGKLQDAKLYTNYNVEATAEFAESQILNSFMQLDDLDKVNDFISKMDSLDLLSKPEIADSNVFDGKSLKNVFNSYRTGFLLARQNKDNNIYVITLLSREYLDAGYPRMAIYLLESKKDSFSNYYDGLYFLTLAYFNAGEYEKALGMNVLVEEKGYMTYEMQILAAKSYVQTGDISSASKYFERAIQYAPDVQKFDTLIEYAKMLSSQQQYSKALVTLRNAEAKSDSADLRVEYLNIYMIMKEYDKMPVHLDKLSTYSNAESNYTSRILKYYIKMYLETSKPDQAKEKLDALAKLGQTDSEYNLLLGKYYLTINDKPNALKSFENAIGYDLTGTVSEEAQRLLEQGS